MNMCEYVYRKVDTSDRDDVFLNIAGWYGMYLRI